MSYVFGILIILVVLGSSIIFYGGIAWEIVELICKQKRREEEKWFNRNCGWLESEIVTPGIIEQQELLCQLSQEKMIYPEAEEFGNAPSGNLCQ